MINTDKYKGHTEGPWFYYDDGGISNSIRLYHQPYMESDSDDTEENLAEIHYDENCIADARLMADAPLLLEEVKRLREQIVDMIDSMDNYYIRDIQHATDCLRDMIGYYEDEEE
tara:strand:+ start:9181 stop:9522 length:342 start_codon:yes stop_codon:yes gene_type:complete